MKKALRLLISLCLLAFIFTGCRTSPLQNVQNASFATVNAKQDSMNNVSKAIIAAGATLGWQMKKVKEGEIIGTLYLRDHMAQVKIPYTTKDYSILYQNSQNLKYNAADNTIHSNYNGWIQNLNRAIQVQLGLL